MRLAQPERILKTLTQAKSLYNSFINYLFEDTNPVPLGLFRILFGFCLFLDVPQERGLEDADIRFGDPNFCFFPLFPFIKEVPLQYACIIYSIMWAGSLGIMFGYKFRLSCYMHLGPYIYFFLLDKSRWNNHSYLFGLTVMLISTTNATAFCSVDKYLEKSRNANAQSIVTESRESCPKWNYFMLKFQFTLLYVLATVKKIDMDWLSGYSMRNLSRHKVLLPLSSIVGDEIVDYYMIHLGGFIFDLLCGFILNIQKTKKLAFFLSFIFHGLNSQLFEIGMFPYVCLASLILFCTPNEFPCSLFTNTNKIENESGRRKSLGKTQISKAQKREIKSKSTTKELESGSNCHKSPSGTFPNTKNGKDKENSLALRSENESKKHWKGYNNWTQGLYGYSWDMMVNSWDTLHTKVTVRDFQNSEDRYLDPHVWTTNERWSSHADMAKQYASCIRRNLHPFNLTDIGVYFDVWKSLNGRFQQRIFDPRVNILEAKWSPWKPTPWVLPLLSHLSVWRQLVFEPLSREVSQWSHSANVIFVADSPGLAFENYLPSHLTNVTLVLMRGGIIVEEAGERNRTLEVELEDLDDYLRTDTLKGVWEKSVSIKTEKFHKIHTVSNYPSCYMYTYRNETADAENERSKDKKADKEKDASCFCGEMLKNFISFMQEKHEIFSRSFYLIVNAYLNVLFDVPMIIRKEVD